MKEKHFISSFFEETLDDYKNHTYRDVNNNGDFNYIVLKMLFLIYGELDFINPRITNDTNSAFQNMMKFGYSLDNVKKFFREFDDYNLSSENRKRTILSVDIQKRLIDMLFLKKKILNVNENELNVFFAYLCELNDLAALDYYKKNLYFSAINTKEIEYLEVLPTFEENSNDKKNTKLSFEFSSVNGFANIIIILSVIAVICLIIAIISFM